MSIQPEPRNVIYALSCTCHPEKGVRYVGQTTQGARPRLLGHLSEARKGEGTPVYRWIRKHGESNIETTVLEAVEDSALLDEREVFWISEMRTFRGAFGLNMTIGGGGLSGYPLSDDARKRMSDAAKRRGMGHISLADRMSATQGESNWNSKLTEEVVLEIKRMLWHGEPSTGIAERFDVSPSAISHINNRRAWLHVPWPVGPARKQRISEDFLDYLRNREVSPESIEKMRRGISKSWTLERRARESERLSGEGNPQFGVKWSDERKAASSLSRSRLDVADIREIRRLRAEDGLQYEQIAQIIGNGVSACTIGCIVRGTKYKHVA